VTVNIWATLAFDEESVTNPGPLPRFVRKVAQVPDGISQDVNGYSETNVLGNTVVRYNEVCE